MSILLFSGIKVFYFNLQNEEVIKFKWVFYYLQAIKVFSLNLGERRKEKSLRKKDRFLEGTKARLKRWPALWRATTATTLSAQMAGKTFAAAMPVKLYIIIMINVITVNGISHLMWPHWMVLATYCDKVS